MTKDLVTRIRNVFADTPQIITWFNEETYAAAEARAHISGMWEALKEAADRIEELEIEIHFKKLQAEEWACYKCEEKSKAAASHIEELEYAIRSIAEVPLSKEMPDRTTIWGLATYMQQAAKDALGEHK